MTAPPPYLYVAPLELVNGLHRPFPSPRTCDSNPISNPIKQQHEGKNYMGKIPELRLRSPVLFRGMGLSNSLKLSFRPKLMVLIVEMVFTVPKSLFRP
jgi:hypothetical protein